MADENLILNAQAIHEDLEWLGALIDTRMRLYFHQECAYSHIRELTPPDVSDSDTPYGHFIRHYELSIGERAALLLSLAPHINPKILDPFFMKNALYDRGYSEFGGVLGQQHSGFLPTGETLMFLLAADDPGLRIQLMGLFDENHFFARHHILFLDTPPGKEPLLSGSLHITQEFLAYFMEADSEYRPKYSAQFPARRITTKLDWPDLVLDHIALEEIERILAWIEHKDTLMDEWNLARVVKPGYRALFYGPPGTGKTMTAALLGKTAELDVYRIDLSQVVSKYIGETEKNLAGIFDRAENSNWILFFDEADALFGKRTATKDAKDRYANQEISYLLQRIEDFPGIAILATNLKGNLDDAFTRRFQSMVYFQMPNAEQRLKLWRNMFSGNIPLSADINWRQIATQYELSGGAITNVLRFAGLSAVRRNPPQITESDILYGIKKEMQKEGKTGG